MKKADVKNTMKMVLPSLSVNEGMARAAVAAFCAQLDPVGTDIADIKCAVSEAVTNCIVHAYRDTVGIIYITVKLYSDRSLCIEIRDRGGGIEDVKSLYRESYAAGLVRFVEEADEGGFMSSAKLAGKDTLEVSAYGNDERIILTSRFDNLGKGASGAAIQNMNILLGLDEATGLNV